MSPPEGSWRLLCGATGGGAVAVFEVFGDVEFIFGSTGMPPMAPGEVRVQEILGVDRGVIARPSAHRLHLMPHAGKAAVGAVADALSARGLVRDDAPDPTESFVEGRDDVEARALATLSGARSPLAVDLLLDQPRRWRGPEARNDPELDRVLDRLLHPPTVAVIGPTNIGKSTFVNALAERAVSVVADEPGTTRDQVGVAVDCDGLMVHVVDTPGIRVDATDQERRAGAIAAEVVACADLVLACGDPHQPAPRCGHQKGLTLCLRSDLGEPPWDANLVVCVPRGQGVLEVAASIRRLLVPDAALADPRPWLFFAASAVRVTRPKLATGASLRDAPARHCTHG